MTGKETIYFITSNKNKASELEAVISTTGYKLVQKNIGYPEIQADTLEEVVLYGLQHLQKTWGAGEPGVVIEDSGLFIDMLGGFPGVYSAQVFRSLGCKRILKMLEGEDCRKAVFRAVMGLLFEGEPHVVKGECVGTISLDMKGSGGFGYDPIFIPEGENRAFGEMKAEEKNIYSHRARAGEALASLMEGL